MAVTIYKSTDASAPQMTAAAGSLLTVLDACLVDGYGTKGAAGWSSSVVDAATQQRLYTQGSVTGLAQKKLYVKDNAATPGNATAWACDGCTVSATPTFTNNFWTADSTYAGVLVKADQENAKFSKWMIVATDRWFYLFTKRSNWGDRGWQVSFFGDIDSPYPDDKGKCTVMGWDTSSGPMIALGDGCREMAAGAIGVYGNQDGAYEFYSYGFKRAMGASSGYADKATPVSRFSSGLLLSRLLLAETQKYRGALPQIYRSVVSLDAFSWYMLPDEYVLQSPDGQRSYLHIQFGKTITGTSEPGRIFLDITGAA